MSRIEVLNTLPSCDHVRIVGTPKQVEPGGVGHIRVSVLADKPGPFTVAAIVDIKGSAPQRRLFSITGWAVEPVTSGNKGDYLVEPTNLLAQPDALREWTLVDVRPASEFQVAFIAGALNMPLYAVKAQRFLRSRKVLMMADGFDDNRLLTEVPRLRQEGFGKVGVLRGGLRWWQQQGGTITGDTSRLGYVSAQSAWAGQGSLRWCCVNVSRKDGTTHGCDLLNGLSIPFKGDPQAFEAQLQGLATKNGPYDALLLYDDSGGDIRPLAGWAAQTRLLPVFILEGGLSAYSRYCLFQVQLHQRKTQTLARFDPMEFLRTFRATPRGTGCCGAKR